MNYTDMQNKFDQFMNDLKTYYTGEFAGDYDWYAIRNELWFACVDTVDDGREWEFSEPDNDFIVSVLQANERSDNA